MEVRMSADVWSSCLAHALSAESEEVMGLLLGDCFESESESQDKGVLLEDCGIVTKDRDVVVAIWGSMVFRRSDRRKDRVEISAEQLYAGSKRAEAMSERLGCRTRVVGWYHSHPHITVFPSHVDIKTQWQWQQMDRNFVGLIFSCFCQDHEKKSHLRTIAFQSCMTAKKGLTVRSSLSLSVVPHFRSLRGATDALADAGTLSRIPVEVGLQAMAEMPKVVFEEEKELFQNAKKRRRPVRSALAAIHDSAVYSQSLVRILEYGVRPSMRLLQSVERTLTAEIAKVEEDNSRLRRARDQKDKSSKTSDGL